MDIINQFITMVNDAQHAYDIDASILKLNPERTASIVAYRNLFTAPDPNRRFWTVK